MIHVHTGDGSAAIDVFAVTSEYTTIHARTITVRRRVGVDRLLEEGPALARGIREHRLLSRTYAKNG
jgi:hypothetical protein